MSKKLSIEYRIHNISDEEVNLQISNGENAYRKLISNNMDMTGWIDYPNTITDEQINDINKIASEIKDKFTALVIVGIGGSYLGTAAALDFLIREQDKMPVKIFFGGINISSNYHERILRDIDKENVALCIVSKSGGTFETIVGSNIFLDYLEERYGKQGKKERVFVITNTEGGRLKELADLNGFPTLPIPKDIGGRYSVLTAVGLLPMATMGIDIEKVIKGAKSATEDFFIKKAIELAATRNALESKGYSVELLATYKPSFSMLIQWIRQLYGESEGKDGKGMLPVELDYSTDLHSLGQFIQEGRQTFIETFLSFKEEMPGINISKEWGVTDKDIDMGEFNLLAKESAIEAHEKAGIPIIDIEFPRRSEYIFGQAIYFFQMSCAIRGIMMGVNPFDQPGVEEYKDAMNKNLKKR